MLSGILEKNKNKILESYDSKDKEITTLKMPSALIEGFESIIMFSFMILFNKHMVKLI
jgi:hypothetical protein